MQGGRELFGLRGHFSQVCEFKPFSGNLWGARAPCAPPLTPPLIWLKIGHFWTKSGHFLIILKTSGTRGFELHVGFGRVWLFYKTSVSGLSGFIFTVRVFGFLGSWVGTRKHSKYPWYQLSQEKWLYFERIDLLVFEQ